MSTEEQPADILKPELPTFDAVYESIIERMDHTEEDKRFPKLKLKNRLINLGLREFLDGIDQKGDTRRALEAYGFPFKFVSQLDEAALALAYYINRFRHSGGTLKVYGLNKLSKGEDKNLGYWQSAKAKLYLELQNLMLLLNGVKDKKSGIRWHSEVRRIFTFRELADLAFLTQSAASVLSEQLASNVKIGFLFLETFLNSPPIDPISNALIIEYVPPPPIDPEKHNFYELHALLDPTTMHDLPYQDRCTARWFKGRNEAKAAMARLGPLLNLFETRWQDLDDEKHDGITAYKPIGTEFFNSATVMMHKALRNSSHFPKAEKRAEDVVDAFINRLNDSVMTNDFVRLERAISAFNSSEAIDAVDATSVKNSLTLHETDPTYRRWIRTSLNGVVSPGSKKHLRRVYILKDFGRNADREFDALVRIMQYYLDYFHLNISETNTIVNAHLGEEELKDAAGSVVQPWLVPMWNSTRRRIRVCVTTSTILEEFAYRVLRSEGLEGLDEISSDLTRNLVDAHESLTKVDFLYTPDMIYDFTTERADPGELKFEAFLYRKNTIMKDERKILFEFTGHDASLAQLKELQTQHRLSALVRALRQYKDKNETLFTDITDEIRKDKPQLTGTLDTFESNGDFTPDDAGNLLEIRHDVEKRFYDHFHPVFFYLCNVLDYLSVEVDFFKDTKKVKAIDKLSIQEVFPFHDCTDVASFTGSLREIISDRLQNHPEDIPKPPSKNGSGDDHLNSTPLKVDHIADSKTQIFLSYASEDVTKVDELYQRLTEANFAPWQDSRDILGGANPRRAIEQAIKRSDFFVPCLSDNSAGKRGFVQRELNQALDIWRGMLLNDIYLVPVRLDNCQVPEDLKENFQHIDLFKDGSWNEDGWNRLLNAIRIGLVRRKS